MRRVSKGVLFVLVISMVFFSAGCSKKGVDQVEEITPPETAETVDGSGAMMPDLDIEPGVETGLSGLEPEVAAFENQDVYFGYDKFNLSAEARTILAEKASFLNAHPEMKIRVEGHCDERGTSEYNLALGERRAKAAQDYLVFLGINPTRISIISYGEERPVDPGHYEDAWANNRRAHFDVLN